MSMVACIGLNCTPHGPKQSRTAVQIHNVIGAMCLILNADSVLVQPP